MFINSLLILGAYLLGSLSGAIIICKVLGLPDPRTQGSGNPGATNILRQNGKKQAIITLLVDVFKGVIAVLVAKLIISDEAILASVGVAVFLGHLYPIFFHFRGGKGVATAFGVLMMLAWPVSLAALATWFVMAALFRYSSLAAISSAMLTPVYMFLFTGVWEYLMMSFVISSLLIWRHRSNIQNLLAGQERKIR
ncbi:MAG: acyl-phosphate glycerol 3-phosphate acyltransferase [Gammaproteobacteria bacterium]|nr:MAG: acyl-phosphate glycerol 3-phosphate acyltransferase [Gammaproteobacteria bacterium]